MNLNLRTAIPLAAAICGFAMQLTSQAQTPTPVSENKTAQQAAAHGTPILTASVDFTALEKAAAGPVGPASDPSPAAAEPVANPASNPASDPAPATPATVSVTVKNDAMLKELAEMKKAFEQTAQTQAMIKARIDKLETALDPNGAIAGGAAAERDASALRSAESGDSPAEAVASQAAPAPAAATPPEISAERLTKSTPFPGDWTWLNNNGHQVDSPMATKYFTPEFRADANYTIDFNHPEDDTLGGSTETFRSDEWQLEQISVGGDIRIDNVRGRFLCLCGGLWAVTTTRNDPSVVRGSWDLSGAYKYIAEGWGGYHWDVNHGLNVDAGIFVSYIGLFSYYNFDNWTYQPSFVSSNTPWFFNGIRAQWFPTEKLKIEPWFINGWQTYARANGKPGLGGQILWRPTKWLDLVTNNYGLGEDDTLEQQSQLTGGTGATRSRIHTDNSVEVKYYDKPKNFLDKMAFTVTGDLGCEYGGGPASGYYPANGLSPEKGSADSYSGGVNCHNSRNGKPKQSFAGWMMYQRFWFKKDVWAVTLGGGQMTNPGRYLTLLPPINAATAVTGSPYFTENPGDRAQQHDGTVTLDYMPSQFITFRLESGYRFSDIPYWTGHGGITPPGGDNGTPTQYACASGAASGYGYGNLDLAEKACFAAGNGTSATNTNTIWWPDLRTNQTVTTLAIMVRF
jgi:hypothetical protein